jgi:hypothetical protein
MLSQPIRVVCVLIVLTSLHRVGAAEKTDLDDPVAKIATCLPATWKVSLTTTGGHSASIRIETAPMDTVPSLSSADDQKKRATVIIEFEVMPKYSPGMLKRIREYNEPILARLKKIRDSRSRDGQMLIAALIPYPMFQDAQYSYRLIPPHRVASRGEDITHIERVLLKVCAGWKPVEEGKTVVGEIMDYFSRG